MAAYTAPPLRVAHVITSLELGGAQIMLSRLLAGCDRDRVSPEVFSLTDAGPVAADLEAAGVTVRSLGLRRGVPSGRAAWRLANWLRRGRFDVAQTWMYHADLLGGLAATAVGVPTAWGIHHTDLPPESTKRLTRWTAFACARLSGRVPRAIVCCSESARRVHAGLGYAADKLVVIPNAFDVGRFKPDAEARFAVRAALGVGPDAPLIGQIGRFHPQKDHATFLAAAATLGAARPEARFLLAGDDLTPENPALTALIREAGLEGRVHLLGRRTDVPRLMAALDLASLSSAFGEGLPVVIGEAMATAVPCAVTDVGDAARVVGETGWVVAPRDPAALAAAWAAALALGPAGLRERGEAARARVAAHYHLPAMIERYEALHRSIAS